MTRADAIARLNDQFRAGIFGAATVPGQMVMTAGVAALDLREQMIAWLLVKRFADFTPGNNPHGERDFGSISLPSGARLFWKIDYFENSEMQYGAEDPTDPCASYRLLTLMRAEEY